MKKIMKRKMAVAAIAAVSCISIAGSALAAFDRKCAYDIEADKTVHIVTFTPDKKDIALNTRPTSGGGVKIKLSGAATADKSFTFPAAVSVPDWNVTLDSVGKTLTVDGEASSTGAKGVLHIWSR